MKRRPVLSIASEVFPLVKTGGLADVAGALPGALKAEGFGLRTLVPGYPAVIEALRGAETAHTFAGLFGGPARLLAGRAKGLDLFVLDAPHLFDRPGNPYLAPGGGDWPDNAQRFAALARVGAQLGQGLLPGFAPEVIHCHDWQAALAPAYLHYADAPGPTTVMTVHNLAFQGIVPAALLGELGLPAAALSIDGIEYHGAIGYLKAGLRLCDRITTVSPTYASEICTAEFGMGLDGLLRGRADVLRGILNGIDQAVWDPARDRLIPHRYSATDRAPRAGNKPALQARFGLAADDQAPLFGVVSRLSWQKGLDLLIEALPVLLGEGGQLALLGTGDPALEQAFAAAAARHPGQVGCVMGYDEELAHLVQAGADALLVPSRFEPCGLTQLYALRYGCIPVVARVGGLADTVIDASPMALAAGASTGVQFAPVTTAMLEDAIRRACRLLRDREQRARLQANGMATDVSWSAPARAYAAVYRELAPAPSRRSRAMMAARR